MSETDNTNSEPEGVRSRSSNHTTGTTPPPTTNSQRGWGSAVEHIKGHKIDFILAVTRALTVLCTVSYLIRFPGPASNRFKQALLMTAATSSLRLHQRMPPPPLNQLGRTYFSNLTREDSFHYLIFPFIFLFTSSGPVTLALLPCSLYALFNLAVYAIAILDKVGNQEQLKLQISSFVAKYQQSLLHTIALSEIVLMPVLTISIVTLRIGIFLPFFYYRFLLLRYNSTRNAHLKLLLLQIRTVVMTYASRFMPGR